MKKLSAEMKKKLLNKIENMRKRGVVPSKIAKVFAKGILTATEFKKVYK
jgi:hypothetical protein